MLGHSHVISGVTVATALTTFSPQIDSPIKAAIIIGTLGGAAVLPDIDHPGATISRSLPPFTSLLSRIVSVFSGGHRKGTHSIFGWLIFALLAYASSFITLSSTSFGLTEMHLWHIGSGITVGFLTAIALTALHLDPLGVPSYIAGIAIGGLTAYQGVDPMLLAAAVLFGCATHALIGDCLTTQGVPLLYPLNNRIFRLPILGDTGSSRENFYVFLLGSLIFLIPFAAYFMK